MVQQPNKTIIKELLGALSEKIHTPGSQLVDKEELLKVRDKQIEKLTYEIRGKKILFAAEETKIWQSIERRNLWKGRLAQLALPH